MIESLAVLSFFGAIGLIFFFCYQKFIKKEKSILIKRLAIVFSVAFFIFVGLTPTPSASPQVSGETQNDFAMKTPNNEIKPEIEVKEEKIVEEIPFNTVTQDDPSLAKGKQVEKQEGKVGKKEKTFKITYENSNEINRELISEKILENPVDRIVLNGTYTKPPVPTGCDPNYSGACVPIASDVDCAGGSGNGPEYVWGPVYVIGYDKYGLDKDGDGVGCQ